MAYDTCKALADATAWQGAPAGGYIALSCPRPALLRIRCAFLGACSGGQLACVRWKQSVTRQQPVLWC